MPPDEKWETWEYKAEDGQVWMCARRVPFIWKTTYTFTFGSSGIPSQEEDCYVPVYRGRREDDEMLEGLR